MKSKYNCLLFLSLGLSLIQTGTCLITVENEHETEACYRTTLDDDAGVLYRAVVRNDKEHFCWTIKVPSYNYLRLSIKDLEFRELDCGNTYLKISSGPLNLKFCSNDRSSLPKDLLLHSDVNIDAELSPYPTYRNYRTQLQNVYFNLTYSVESIECAQDDHFRCSQHKCVREGQVCNGVEDCENGMDEAGCAKGVVAVSGVNASRVEVINAINSRRSANFGWGADTHRAILSLHLSRDSPYEDGSMVEELMKKELELKLLLALLRNSTELLPVTELGIFVNALTVTCLNPRQFYGRDLLQILGSRVVNSVSPFPGASLALCNSNWTLPVYTVQKLLKILEEESEYPFIQDIQAMALMALTCIQRKTGMLGNIMNATDTYDAMIEKLIANQNPDGSFGNVYTTAIITQALISSGQDTNSRWNVTSTVKYLMQEVKNSTDLLASYLVLPVLNNKTLLDVSNHHCSTTKNFTGSGVENLADRLGKKIHVQYSLYIGDLKDVVHTIYLRVTEKSTAYDVMKIARANDAKYEFSHRYMNKNLYVYSIAGIFNDPESLKFWLLYTTDSSSSEPVHSTKSPDKLIMRNKQHLIMWFRTILSVDETADEYEQLEDGTDRTEGEEVIVDNSQLVENPGTSDVEYMFSQT